MAGKMNACIPGNKKSKMKTKGRKRKADKALDLETNYDSRKMSKSLGDFTCSICSSRFKNGDDLHKHFKLSKCALGSLSNLTDYKGQSVQNNTLEEPAAGTVKYECGYCGMVFPDCSYLEIHISGGCPGVSKGTSSSESASNNSELLLQSKELECGLCRIKFGLLKDLISHIKVEHYKEEDNENDVDTLKDRIDYVCGKCNLEFKCSKAMRSHMKECFSEYDSVYAHGPQSKFDNDGNRQSNEDCIESEYLCGQCGNRFKSSKILVQHISTVHTAPEIATKEKSPVKECTKGPDNDNVTIPNSILIRYMNNIQCDGCFNFSKLNFSNKCTFCNQLINVKVNQVICLCTLIPLKSLESLVSHLSCCKDLQSVTNRKNLALNYSKKDHKRRFCVNDQLKEKDSDDSKEMTGKSVEYSSAYTKGGRKEVEGIPPLTKQCSVTIEDYDSESTDTDSSGFEEIIIDRTIESKGGKYPKLDNELHESMLEDQVEYKFKNDLFKYDIMPCKVVLERIPKSKIELYQRKRKRTISPEESERSRFKQSRTNKFDGKTNEHRSGVRRYEELDESYANSQEYVSGKRAVAKKRSHLWKGRFEGSYSEEIGKCTQSELAFKNENQVQRNNLNKTTKNSLIRVNENQDVKKSKVKDTETKDDFTLQEPQFLKEKEEEIFTCEICTSTFSSTEALEQHSETHLPIFKCSECDLTFNTKESLSKHADSHVLEDEFVCGICQSKFSVQEKLEIHMIKHFGSPKLPESSLVMKADSSTTTGPPNTKKTNQGQHILPKLLAYKPKIKL